MFNSSPISDLVRRARTATLLAVVVTAGLLAAPQPARAIATAVPLGTAASFGVLAGSTVTNTGPSLVDGDLGVDPGSTAVGFPPGTVSGTIHLDDAVALQAQTDLTIGYNNAAGQATDAALPADAGGLTLVPGVYTAPSSLGLTGTLTLDAQGNAAAVWVFQVPSALTTATDSTVALINGANACNVFWQVGSSATLGTNSTFVGTIMALTAITLNTGTTVIGRALARNAAVTMQSNVISPSCVAAVPAITVSKSVSPTSRPAPGGSFTYSVTVTNDGLGDVTLTSLIDDVYGDLNGQGDCAIGGTIAPAASYSCSFAQNFTGVSGDSLTDTVTAIVEDDADTPATGSDDATATITGPRITVVKTANPTSRPEPGGSFTFTVRVTNTSSDPATLTSLVDDIYGDLNGVGTCNTGGTILAGATYQCSFARPFTGPAGASQTDTITAVVTDANQDTATGSDDATVTITPRTGILEICKLANNVNGRVTGNFSFTWPGGSATVPVNSCTGPLTVPAGNLTVTEAPRAGTRLSACSTRPTDRLLQCNLANRSAVVRIVAGGVAEETVLYFTNRADGPTPPSTTSTSYQNLGTAPIKVCKVAGAGVPVGTPFNFTLGSRNLTVRAGPASQGGYCKIAYGFARGSTVTVTEAAAPNVGVQAITVRPPDRRTSSNTAARTATVRIGRGFTVVTFTNAARQ